MKKLFFDVETIDEALKLQSEDPAIKVKRLEMQAFYRWGQRVPNFLNG